MKCIIIHHNFPSAYIYTCSLGYILHLSTDFPLTRTQGVQEEEKLANCSADVERVEGLLQSVQLRQSGDQL